jgi:cation transport ATPase
MMTLVALGIPAAYVYSAATTFFLEGEGFYWELATLVDVMLLGHWIEMASVQRASGALTELAKLIQNLLWATGYNAVAIPLAAGVAATWGVLLPPAVGALLMSLSTVIVAANAQLLRRESPLAQTG